MQLGDLAGSVLRRWRFFVAVLLLCAAATGALIAFLPVTYTAQTSLYVSMATGTSVNDSYQGGMAAQQRMASYSNIAGGPMVAEQVIRDVGLSTTPVELQKQIKVTVPPATTLLDISVTDRTPEGARLLADKVAAHVRAVIGQLETTVVGAAPAAQATVVEYAAAPTKPTSPNIPRLVIIGALAGLVLGAVAALARDRLDTTLRSADQLDRLLPVPVLVTIPTGEEHSSQAVAQLRARLMLAPTPARGSTLALTSLSRSQPAVIARLARALANSNRRIALVDADVSGTGPSALLGLTDLPGLADLLRTPAKPSELMREWEGVGVLPLGVTDERTSVMLESGRFGEIIARLCDEHDYVLVALPPVISDTAAVALAPRFNSILAMVELGTTSAPQVRAAVSALGGAEGPLVGVVAIAAPTSAQDAHAAADFRRLDGPAVPATP